MPQSLNVRKFATYSVLAAIINSIIFQIAKSFDAKMIVNQGGSREIVLPMVVTSTLFGLLVAAYVVNLIGKKSTNFISKTPTIGLVFGIVTAAAPFAASEDSKTSIGLAFMHIVAGLIWYFGTKKSINK
jgi:membrane protein DedA with SNARE-associated domain